MTASMMESNDLDEASLWINAVNDAHTFWKSNSIEELVGQTVGTARKKGVDTPDLCAANCGAKLEESSGCTNYWDVSSLSKRVEISDVGVDDDAVLQEDQTEIREDHKENYADTEQTNEDFQGSGVNQDCFTARNCICKRQVIDSLGESHTKPTESFTPTESKSEIDCGTLQGSSPKIRDCFIPILSSINDLKTRFGSEYELHLNIPVGKCRSRGHTILENIYKFKKQLLVELEEWESELNECCLTEPYIAVENRVDNARPPDDFKYITHSIIPASMRHRFDENYLVGCSCARCTPLHCECPQNHGASFAYDQLGRIQFEPGKPVYECNPQCSCSITCKNRVVQRGRTVKVKIFRTSDGRGWGVTPMEPIQKNQFVTEYVGELITNEEAEQRGKCYDAEGQTYLFDLDYNEEDCQFTLDAKEYGNISHFINHSCDPNLSVYGVWCDTLDPTLPQIALFASRDIAAGEELTFDYLMTAEDKSPRKTKRIRCGCGSKGCRRYLY